MAACGVCARLLWLAGLLIASDLQCVVAQTTKYINAGGLDYDDGTRVWEDDAPYYNLGSPYSTTAAIAGTTIDPLYQIERYGKGLMYTIPLSSGTYDVSLFFAEIYFNRTDTRVFDVKLEGTTEISGLDIFDKVGSFTALVEVVEGVQVNDGALDIDFVSVQQNPKIQGIAIVPSSGGPAPTPAPSPGFAKRVNAGGSLYTDPRGNVWENDAPYFNLGSPYTTNAAISNTDLDPMYQVERYGSGLMYTITGIPDGQYTVSLFFAEIYFNRTDARVFHVKLEGTTEITGLDIYKEAGNRANRAVVKTIQNVAITGGALDIDFVMKTQNPKIQGIEILSASGGTPPPTPKPTPKPTPSPTPSPPGGFVKYINAGGSDYDDGTVIWENDAPYFNLGSPFTTDAAISNTVRDPLYQVERYGQGLMYTIPGIPSGFYDISLHFAEIYFTQTGSRRFDVKLEDTTVITNLDIVSKVGADTALVEVVENFQITDGALDISFVSRQQNPKIQGIEIVQASGSPSTPAPTPSTPAPTPSPPNGAVWIDLDENERYTARHECSFVQAGNKFYLFGGRENPRRLDTYDYATDTWSRSDDAPLDFNHFQAIEYAGLIWVIGAYKDNSFPTEMDAENVHVYDPANDVWMLGPEIPASRRRGGGGLQVYNDKFYLVGGNNMGHESGFVPYMDEYNPRTGQWRQLDDAPRARDHFHAAVVGNRLYAAGGRRTADDQDNTFGDVIPEVDVFDFGSESWLPPSSTPQNLPVPRAAAATAVFNGKVIIAGGESLQSDAHDDVHSLDPATGQWKRLDSLNWARHGTQAIVSGQGIYVVAGSPDQGGGNQKNMEVYNQDSPSGEPSVAGTLSGPSLVEIQDGAPRMVTLQQDGGNQGIFVNAMSIAGPQANDFTITSGFPTQILILNGQSHDVFIQYTGTLDNAEAQLSVLYSAEQILEVDLRGRTGSSTSPLDIVDLVIVNAMTDNDISSVDSCNGCLTTSTSMSIRAVPRGTVGSVRLILSGPRSRTALENVAPYSLWGDRSGNYAGETLAAGEYTIQAQAFSQTGGNGTPGTQASATFSVV